MLNQPITLPLWAAIPVLVLGVLGAKAYVIDPLVRRALLRRERDLKARLRTTLTRPLPKVLQVPRRVLMERLFNDTEVQAAIDTASRDQGREAAEKETLTYIDELMPSFFALFYFHIGYWLARRWLRSMYDIQIVRQPPPEAFTDIPEDASIVLVGNHRSNLDVAVLSYLAARTSMISFAAGEWASVWPVNRIMQMSGCYIIRRDSQGRLYKTVLARYVHMMIGAHMPQGIFLEGGLSRDGAIQPVKLGLMRYILAGLGTDNTTDIVFIPVAFNYDRVPEDMTLLAHQDQGFTKKSRLYTVKSTLMHSFGVIARLLKIKRQRFGQAAVSFGPALSAKEWLAQRGETVEGLDDISRKAMVAPMAETIIQEISDIIPVLPVSLVAQVVTSSDAKTLTRKDFQKGVLDLIDVLGTRNAPLATDDMDDRQVHQQGLDVLLARNVLLKDGDTYRINPDQRPLLEYYARTISHHLDQDDSAEHLRSILTVREPGAS
ncbi:glycerol-3-phosphate O-acyltransferase [Shimia gijangensis]|uniref:Glycerol-3-phosphate acyltransferase n=1 Tax=Shimia gijangensis TaxID=1470563 RepID=A0A1M6Q4D4_9RHOB|nr:1-acyl-sn-glycerol-3-phosphate acyltransferase [Shimia gijangensis]SHK15082.1 glycerol-3-phosphate O-acyltransferase [Shimia gijangensis]